jgi:hypothetical protein
LKNDRLQNRGKLYATGRDIEDIELHLEFDKDTCLWKMISHNDEDTVKADNPILCAIDKIVQSGEWRGTSTELVNEIIMVDPATDIKANVLARTLNSNSDLLLSKFNIQYSQKRLNGSKIMIFTRAEPPVSDMSDNTDIFTPPPSGE